MIGMVSLINKTACKSDRKPLIRGRVHEQNFKQALQRSEGIKGSASFAHEEKSKKGALATFLIPTRWIIRLVNGIGWFWLFLTNFRAISSSSLCHPRPSGGSAAEADVAAAHRQPIQFGLPPRRHRSRMWLRQSWKAEHLCRDSRNLSGRNLQ